MTNKETLKQMFEALLPWYQSHKRDLPWRKDWEPYHVWLSEIMLQQTRVEAVKEYYHRFITALPTIDALAKAPEEQLLKLWEGLGYYNRVRNLQKAAITICEQYGGTFPEQYEEIRSLSGIGDYTAGAISSICFELPTPAVDGNVLRVYTRLLGDTSNIDKASTKKMVSEQLRQAYPKENPGCATQGLMELGATVCVPNGTPKCELCPLAELCSAKAHGTWQKLPVRDEKKKRKVVKKTVFVLSCDGQYALHKRSGKGLLAAMWEFPNIDVDLNEQEAVEKVTSWKLAPEELLLSTKYTHIFSHVEWQMTAYYIRCKTKNTCWSWASLSAIDAEYALPSAFRPFREMLTEMKRIDSRNFC